MNTELVANAGLILEAETGSSAYGLQTVDSDKDLHGICIEHPRIITAPMERFTQHKTRLDRNGYPISSSAKTPPGSVERTVVTLREFVASAVKGNVSNLVPLFAGDWEHGGYFWADPSGKCLVRNRRILLSKQTYGMKRYLGHQVDLLVETHCSGAPVNTKQVYQIGKLLFQANVLLRFENLTLNEWQLDFLKGVRAGTVSMDVALPLLVSLLSELDGAFLASKLPDRINRIDIDDFVSGLYIDCWKARQWL